MKVHPFVPGTRHPKIFTFGNAQGGRWYLYRGDRFYKITDKQLVTHTKFHQPSPDTILLEPPSDVVVLRGHRCQVTNSLTRGFYLDDMFYTYSEIMNLVEKCELMYVDEVTEDE
jgi:hypothetical protein